MQGISRALSTQKLASMQPYTDEFRKNIVGRAPADLAKSYPEHEHARKVGKLTSKVCNCVYSVVATVADTSRSVGLVQE